MRVAFGHRRRAGKDTSCDYLIRRYGGIKMAFATPLYKILEYSQQVCGFAPGKHRKFLQFVGTEWARGQNENVWIDLLLSKLPEHGCGAIAEGGNVFVCDLRFKNEFAELKRCGFTCVKINRNVGSEVDDHQSDHDLDDCEWDAVLQNNGTVENLYQQLEDLVCGLTPEPERNES